MADCTLEAILPAFSLFFSFGSVGVMTEVAYVHHSATCKNLYVYRVLQMLSSLNIPVGLPYLRGKGIAFHQ